MILDRCLLFLLCLNLSSAAGQNIAGKVTYKTEMIIPPAMFEDVKESDPETYRKYQELTNKIKDAHDQLEYILIFNGHNSIYKTEPAMGKQDGFLDKLISAAGTHYNDLNSGERLEQNELQGKHYIIAREPLEWKISGETKQIGEYCSVKATSTQNFFSFRTNENTVQHIEAWFVPEIPVAFGPKGYAGLPGLIIDLSVAGTHYFATNVRLGPIKEEIQKPGEGKVVSFEEFQAISGGISEKFKTFHGFK